MTKQIAVVGAVIVHENKVLAAQRAAGMSLPLTWEFPGGKVEAGESLREALRREVEEELSCIVEVGDELLTTTHAYDFGDVTLTTFWCELRSGTPTLTEHSRLVWAAPADLESLDWAPADVPAVMAIMASGLTQS
ncbi:8-oxo-dGTP diphosphatase [Microbacterium sp. W4I4]|uniref:(deoxy)nucleoside triphosphate pyrophosphohydrolase n=1 Tax=Microbacterium sp. W4I4 TaxID=3042295 RepID=UPI002782A51F|nr:(deoxy)nucleoside triphosphate pyrophosphohydrolase [Microbacterium sp. W4I4]MDQ0614412.1 8-oxo-dGTP diphosphatase [Microbacterium sp. W4I4]